MPNHTVSEKLVYLRRTGPDLSPSQLPELVNILKIVGLTPRSGNNSRTAYTGAANGLTPGGTLTTLRQGETYEFNFSKTDGTYSLPDFVKVTPPKISSLGPLSVAPGDTLNITGTNLLWTKTVLVGGVQAVINSAATTNTSVAVTVPLTAAVGSNIPVALFAETGSDINTALTITAAGGGATKLLPPANLRQTGSTTTSITMAWDSVANATGYRLRRNGSTTLLAGGALNYTETGLTAGATPSYDVQAIGGGSYSDSNFSAAVQAATTGGGGATAPQLQSARVEQNSRQLITATFNKSLDPAVVPMAGDFMLSSTHRVLGEALPVRTGEILASGYHEPTNSAQTIVAGSSTAVLNRDVRGCMFQAGTVTKARFYCPAFAPGAQVYVIVGGSTQEVTGQLTFGQVNTVTLPTPVTVPQFERVGLYVTGDTGQLGWPVSPAGGGLGGADYGLDTMYGVSDQNIYVSVQCFVDKAPYFAVMGNSLIAGYPSNQPSPMGGRAQNVSLAGVLADALKCTYQDMSWSGQTTTQMLARFDQDIVAKKPRYCWIEGGYNNLTDPNVGNDLLEMGRRCIVNDIIPIFTGSAPNGSPTESYQPGLRLLADLTTLIRNYVNAQPAGKAYLMDFGPILGDPGPVDPANPGGGPVHYLFKAAYYSGDRIHHNQAGIQAVGDAAVDFVLKRTPVGLTGNSLTLKIDRAFVLSDAPVSLSFNGSVKPIQSTDGGITASLSMQPITLALNPEAEVLNFVRANIEQNGHYRADKFFAPGVAGYVNFNPVEGNSFVLAVSPNGNLLNDFREGSAWIENPGRGAGVSIANGQTFFTAPTGGAILSYIKGYYRLSIASNGAVELLSSDDGITYASTGASTTITHNGLYVYALYGPAPTNTKAFGVTALPTPGSFTDTGANYRGAIAPTILQEDVYDSRKLAYVGEWKAATDAAIFQSGKAYVLYPSRNGSVLIRGRGRGVKLIGIVRDAALTISINGQAPVTIDTSAASNNTSTAFYTSALSSGSVETEVLLAANGSPSYTFLDAVEWVN